MDNSKTIKVITKIDFRRTFIKMVFFVLLIFGFCFMLKSSVFADCSDPACESLEYARHYCSDLTVDNCIRVEGSYYEGNAVVGPASVCEDMGMDCGDYINCIYSDHWTLACGQCWCGGGGGGTDYNGVVLAEDTGGTRYVKPDVQVSPSSGTRKWQVGHFDIKDADAGSNSITLSQLAPGYDDCSWSIWNYSTGAPTGESGDTCTAVFDLPASDWKRRVDFTMRRTAYVLGRVREETGAPFFRLDTEPDSCPCPTGSCEEMSNLSVSCETTPLGESDPVYASWGCNPGGAYYSTGTGSFSLGDNLFCGATMASTDYQFVSWRLSNASGVTTGDCQGTNFCSNDSFTLDEGSGGGGGDNHLHFIVEPAPREAWWQVIDGDIATNGGLVSLISQTCVDSAICQGFLDLAGPGGYPGIPSYLGTAGFDAGAVSETGWIAESRTRHSRVYDYTYFENMISPDVNLNEIEPDVDTITGGTLRSGLSTNKYIWWKKEGDLTITGSTNLHDDKIILLVTGTLYLGDEDEAAGAKIRLDDGEGFFAAIAGNNIVVSPKVKVDPLAPSPVLEGIFLAGNEFRTGTTGIKEDGQFWLRGSVAAYGLGGIILERDMMDSDPNNDETPAELFEYAPDLILTFPRELTSRRLRWKEVAP